MTASAETEGRGVLVDLADVSKRFGAATPALDGVTAQVRGAEITGLVGPDGAGKTTLIRLMTGLMIPEAGSVVVLGHDSRRQPAAIQNLIGYRRRSTNCWRSPISSASPRDWRGSFRAA